MRLIAILAAIAFLAASPAKAATDFGTKAEAVAMVERVQEMFKREGADATFKAVSDPASTGFHDRDLYPFIFTMGGVCVAHGARPAMIGKSFLDIKDQDGNYIFREIITLAKGPGTGWVDYKWPNPLTNKIDDKTSYIEKLGDDYIVGVGIYKQ